MSNSKSGFEIRADLLGQAQGILELNNERTRDAVFSHNDSFPEDKQELPVQLITASDVIATAKELYEFVNEK
jgi:exonuclease I